MKEVRPVDVKGSRLTCHEQEGYYTLTQRYYCFANLQDKFQIKIHQSEFNFGEVYFKHIKHALPLR